MDESQDMLVKSSFEELGSIPIHKAAMENGPGEAVFCHNDLTPRNIIVQKRASSDGTHTYNLAGIIDWELAGFYPPSYELSLQDTYLGTGDRHLSFYLP
jgi:thiamine kinase-like enzyme